MPAPWTKWTTSLPSMSETQSLTSPETTTHNSSAGSPAWNTYSPSTSRRCRETAATGSISAAVTPSSMYERESPIATSAKSTTPSSLLEPPPGGVSRLPVEVLAAVGLVDAAILHDEADVLGDLDVL